MKVSISIDTHYVMTMPFQFRPVQNVRVEIDGVGEERVREVSAEVLAAVEGAAEAAVPRVKLPPALSGLTDFTERFGPHPESLDVDAEEEVVPGVKVTSVLLVDERVGHLVTRFADSPHFASVVSAVQEAVAEMAVGLPIMEDAGGEYDPSWAMNVLAHAAADEQPVQLVAQERVHEYEAEHALVARARAFIEVADEIVNNEAAMTVLDTGYGAHGGRTLGAMLRDVAESNLRYSPGVYHHMDEMRAKRHKGEGRGTQ